MQAREAEEEGEDVPMLTAEAGRYSSRSNLSSLTWPAILLAAVAFCVNCKPSEPYLALYLEEVKGLSEAQLDDRVWPADTYATFAFLVPVTLAAEVGSYPHVIAVGLLCRQLTRVLLLYGSGFTAVVGSQITFACASNVDTVLFAYIYFLVDPAQFQGATSAVQGAYHAGNVLAALVAQLLVSYAGWAGHLTRLFYLSWTMTSCGCLLFLLSWRTLRRCQAVHAGRAAQLSQNGTAMQDALAAGGPGRDLDLTWPGLDNETPHTWRSPSRLTLARTRLGFLWAYVCGMVQTARRSYADAEIRAWSCWWVTAYAANFIFGNYYQTLLVHFYHAAPYGLLEMLLELGALIGAASASWPWLKAAADARPGWVMLALSLLSAACCGLATLSWPSPAMLFLLVVGEGLGMASLFALASAAIARRLPHTCYAVTFGANMLLALGLSTAAVGVTSAMAASTSAFMWLCCGLFLSAPLAAWCSRFGAAP